jgi:ribosome-binding ATPase YchF (GTP1/OBG family)
MKVALVGVTGVPLGKHKVRDPRLDQADKLVKADTKTYASVDVVGEEEASTADALVASPEGRFDLIVKDLEFAETRLERNPPAAEKAVLERIKAHLEGEGVVAEAGLTPEELHLIESHAFVTAKPMVIAEAADIAAFDNFLVRVVKASGYISFLTVGGSENRAWLIRKGATAQEAGGAIHTDIQRGFIRAEIIGFDDLVAAGGETQAKHANKMRVETKTYVMQDYDLTNFRFNKK